MSNRPTAAWILGSKYFLLAGLLGCYGRRGDPETPRAGARPDSERTTRHPARGSVLTTRLPFRAMSLLREVARLNRDRPVPVAGGRAGKSPGGGRRRARS